MDDFIHEMGMQVRNWGRIKEESKGGKISLRTEFSKSMRVTKLAWVYLLHTTIHELMNHFNTVRHANT